MNPTQPSPTPYQPQTTPPAFPSPQVPKQGTWKMPVAILIGVLVLAGGAYALMRNSPGAPLAHLTPSPTPTATPTPDPTVDWKTYTNTILGLSIDYPQAFILTRELNDQFNRLSAFGLTSGDQKFEVRLQKDTDPNVGVKYGFLGADIISNNDTLGGITGYQAVSAKGYGDAGSQGLPYVEFGARKNGDVYHLIFYGDALVSEEERQILSTFKFTEPAAAVPAGWKTYTNTQYGFEFRYPSNNATEITQDGARIRIQNYNSNTDALQLEKDQYYLYISTVPSGDSCLPSISNAKIIASTSEYKVYVGTASQQGGDTGGTVFDLCAVKTGQYPYYSVSVTENNSGTIANNIFATFKFTK